MANPPTTTTLEINSIWLIYLFACSGIAFAGYCTHKVLAVKPHSIKKKDEERNTDEQESMIGEVELSEEQVNKMRDISEKIGNGSDVFLFAEYIYLLIFTFILALLIFFFGEKKQWTVYTTMSFITGALTSMLCGFLGMKIAVNSNYKTTYSAL